MNSIRVLQRGVAAVELGLLLVPMVTLVFGVTEYGRAMYQYNAITKSVRDGARYLSQYGAGAGWPQARCLVAHGDTACTGQPLLPGLTAAMVEVDDASDTPALRAQPVIANGVTVGVTNLVRVSVPNYQFVSLISYVAPPTITFAPISVTMTQALP